MNNYYNIDTNANKCEETNRQGMLQILKKWYSFEKSHSILQIVSEDDFL